VADDGRPTAGAAAKRARALGVTAVAAIVLGAFAYGLLGKPFGQATPRVADAGGGPTPTALGVASRTTVSTLPPVAAARQDAAGGGGADLRDAQQPLPDGIGPLSPQDPPAFAPLGPALYLSSTGLIEPNRSVVFAGRVQVNSSGPGFQTNGSLTGCGVLGAADYYAIPLRNPVSYSGPPQIHLRFDGSGPVHVTLFQQDPATGRCTAVGSGAGMPSGGIVDVTLSGDGHTFPVGLVPGIVVSGQGVFTTDAVDPSYGLLPGLTGV
jgi:hypothetical protein